MNTSDTPTAVVGTGPCLSYRKPAMMARYMLQRGGAENRLVRRCDKPSQPAAAAHPMFPVLATDWIPVCE